MSDTFKVVFGYMECIPGSTTCKNCGYEYKIATYRGETCCDDPVLVTGEPTVINHPTCDNMPSL